ncbi:MFS transporter [Paludifilum halophilum]|nr:MFS transporter [Paludifilum halophilum]
MIWLLIAAFGTFLGNSLHFVAISWIVLDSPSGVAGLGIVALTKFLPYLMFGKLSSNLSRKHNTARVTVFTDLIRSGVVLVGYFFILLEIHIQLTIWIITFLIHSLSAIFLPSYFAAIAQRFKGESKTIVKFNSYSTVLIQLGDILGSLTAAGLLLLVSTQHLLLVDSMTYFLSALLLILGFRGMKQAQEKTIEEDSEKRKQENLKWWNPSVLSITLMGSAVATVVLLFNTLAPIKAKSLVQDPTLFANMNALYAVGSALGGLVVANVVKDRLKMRSLVPYGSLMVLMVPLFLLMKNPLWLMIMCFFIGLVNGGWGSVIKSVPQIIFPVKEVGPVTNQRVIIETIIALVVSCTLVLFPIPIENMHLLVIVSTALLLITLLILPVVKVKKQLTKGEVKNEEHSLPTGSKTG